MRRFRGLVGWICDMWMKTKTHPHNMTSAQYVKWFYRHHSPNLNSVRDRYFREGGVPIEPLTPRPSKQPMKINLGTWSYEDSDELLRLLNRLGAHR